MTFLEKVFIGNTAQTWLMAIGAALIVFLILFLIKRIMLRRFSDFAARSTTQVDDLLLAVLGETKILFLVIVSVYIGSHILVLSPTILNVGDKIFFVVTVIQIAFWVGRAINFVISANVKKRMADDAASATTISVLGFIGKLLLWSIVLLLILDNMGVNITSLVAGLGIGGIAVALAAQNILGDLFASLSIVIDKPFVIGDFIVVDQLKGTVEHIGMKTTRLRSLGGEQLIFSNNDLLKSRIQNFKRMLERRIVFGFGVTYQTPPEKLSIINEIVREIIIKQQQVRFDRVHFKECGESALNFEVVYTVKNQDYNLYMDIQQAINLEMLRRFREEGIEFAYPTRMLFIRHEGHKS
ncbi:MAG: mechanosensitive ion channel protein MscS [Deltaproteobacteria bacterium HGW-Deltaproteobacteria-12]|jgi:small-conductance mechanosensitive channel|nr:MAG: mechanosensitive ion channel protein MscS [Deltaproteobacteria bacterium HGW-Deltaproteobacteria-12]